MKNNYIYPHKPSNRKLNMTENISLHSHIFKVQYLKPGNAVIFEMPTHFPSHQSVGSVKYIYNKGMARSSVRRDFDNSLVTSFLKKNQGMNLITVINTLTLGDENGQNFISNQRDSCLLGIYPIGNNINLPTESDINTALTFTPNELKQTNDLYMSIIPATKGNSSYIIIANLKNGAPTFGKNFPVNPDAIEWQYSIFNFYSILNFLSNYVLTEGYILYDKDYRQIELELDFDHLDFFLKKNISKNDIENIARTLVEKYPKNPNQSYTITDDIMIHHITSILLNKLKIDSRLTALNKVNKLTLAIMDYAKNKDIAYDTKASKIITQRLISEILNVVIPQTLLTSYAKQQNNTRHQSNTLVGGYLRALSNNSHVYNYMKNIVAKFYVDNDTLSYNYSIITQINSPIFSYQQNELVKHSLFGKDSEYEVAPYDDIGKPIKESYSMMRLLTKKNPKFKLYEEVHPESNNKNNNNNTEKKLIPSSISNKVNRNISKTLSNIDKTQITLITNTLKLSKVRISSVERALKRLIKNQEKWSINNIDQKAPELVTLKRLISKHIKLILDTNAKDKYTISIKKCLSENIALTKSLGIEISKITNYGGMYSSNSNNNNNNVSNVPESDVTDNSNGKSYQFGSNIQ